MLDTSTLQALHRGVVLNALVSLYPGGVAIPTAVARQTRQAHERLGSGLVPDLETIDWIQIEHVEAEDLEAHATDPSAKARRGKREISTKRPLCHGFAVDREEFEVVVLALRLRATAIIDDRSGLRCARNLDVRSRTTIETLNDLTAAGLLQRGLDEVIETIRSTGYHPTLRKRGR